jgi:hypothetical protein
MSHEEDQLIPNLYRFLIYLDIFSLGKVNLLTHSECGQNTPLKEKKHRLKIEDSPWMISKILGITEYLELTLYSKKIV